jgi:hypothetical protein
MNPTQFVWYSRPFILWGVYAMAVSSSHANASNIIYSFANYPTLQNGYTIAGTIVTDGTIGVLPYSSIVSASFSVTNGAITWTLTKADDVYGVMNLVATASQILLPPDTTSGAIPDLSIGSGGYETPHIQIDYKLRGGYSSDYYCDVDHQFTLTQVWTNNGPNPFNLHGESLVIANIVPEPSTIALFAIGTFGLLFARRRIQRDFSPVKSAA